MIILESYLNQESKDQCSIYELFAVGECSGATLQESKCTAVVKKDGKWIKIDRNTSSYVSTPGKEEKIAFYK